MADVKDILAVLHEQERERLHQQELQSQRDIERMQRVSDLSNLKDELVIAQRNREHSKAVLIEQLKRDESFHGQVIEKLLADTWEALFIFKFPDADKRIISLQEQIESIQKQ